MQRRRVGELAGLAAQRHQGTAALERGAAAPARMQPFDAYATHAGERLAQHAIILGDPESERRTTTRTR